MAQREKNGRWRARVKIKGAEHYIGTFDTKEEAEEEESLERLAWCPNPNKCQHPEHIRETDRVNGRKMCTEKHPDTGERCERKRHINGRHRVSKGERRGGATHVMTWPVKR